MPRGDGTGPMGQGPMTGRRMGYCNDNDIARQPRNNSQRISKDDLKKQKKQLEEQLTQINKELNQD